MKVKSILFSSLASFVGFKSKEVNKFLLFILFSKKIINFFISIRIITLSHN